MPWSNQNGGGGWKGGSGGPWGQPPRGPSGGGGGPGGNPPDLEELLRRGQDRLKSVLGGGGGSSGGGGGGAFAFGAKGITLGALVALGLWLFTGVYRVEPDEVGVELFLGKVVDITAPGLNYNWPGPIGATFTPQVLAVREVTIGARDVQATANRSTTQRAALEESLMVTGDENIVDIDFRVQWNIKTEPRTAAADFLFNIQDPEGTVRAVAESAMREVVGKFDIQRVLTEDRAKIELEVSALMQTTLDGYGAGIDIRLVQMQKVDPPSQVIDAFRDVQAARADAERAQNEAQAYANKIVPEARGEAARIIESATGYKTRTVEEARGQADRFIKVYDEYRKAPQVTRERMYLETMERVFGGMDKVILDQAGNGQGVVPFLPLDQLNRQAPAPAR